MKNKIYCIYCGKKNNMNDKKCKYCGKLLNEKEHEFIDFILEEAGDKVKGSLFDKIILIMKNLVTKYLYGTILTVSIVGAVGSTIASIITTSNDTPSEDIKVVEDKYSFSELSDEVKLLGCFRGTRNIDDSTIQYLKFYDLDKFVSVTMSYDNGREYNPTYNRGYYLVFDEDYNGHSFTNLYFGPRKVVEAQYFQMLWSSDDVFRYGELDYAETRYERIACADFPAYSEEDFTR